MNYYQYVTSNRQTCFYTSTTRMKKDEFVRRVRKAGVLNIDERSVQTVSILQHCPNMVDVSKKSSQNSMEEIKENAEIYAGFIERIHDKLNEDGTIDMILDSFIEVASEFGMELTKDGLKEAVVAESDIAAKNGSIIVYGNYLFVS